jgi:protein phosphatase
MEGGLLKPYNVNHLSFSEKSKRERNEDRIIAEQISKDRFLFAIADGMGGYSNGDIVADTVIKLLHEYFTQADKISKDLINEIISKIHFKITDQFLQSGSTLGGIIMEGSSLFYFWVGDVKISINRDGEQVFQSKDHNLLSLLQEAQVVIKPEEVNRLRNTVTQALGFKQAGLKASMGSLEIKSNTKIFICSDGVSNLKQNNWFINNLPDGNEIENINRLRESCQKFSDDNYSGIFIWM